MTDIHEPESVPQTPPSPNRSPGHRDASGQSDTSKIESGNASFIAVASKFMGKRLATKVADILSRDGASPALQGTVMIRGVLGVATGIAVVAWPDKSLSVMVVVLGIYAALDGLLSLVRLLITRQRAWVGLAEGLAGLAVGVLAFTRPHQSSSALLKLLAVWVIVMGAFRLQGAVHFEPFKVKWVAALLAILAIVIGASALISPTHGAQSVLTNIGIFQIVNGVSLIASIVSKRKQQRHASADTSASADGAASGQPASLAQPSQPRSPS